MPLTLTASIMSIVILNPGVDFSMFNSEADMCNEPGTEIWNFNDRASFEDWRGGLKGSYSPVGIASRSMEQIQVELDTTGSNDLTERKCILSGSLGDEVLRSMETTLEEGRTSFLVNMVSAIPAPHGFAGDVDWTLSCGSLEIHAGVSRLEVYNLTKTLPDFFENRVTVNVTRAFLNQNRDPTFRGRWPALTSWLPSWTGGLFMSKDYDYTPWAIQAAFGRFNYKYDRVQGGSSFLSRARDKKTKEIRVSHFEFERWRKGINSRGSRCNCYDQAASVHIALGLKPGSQTQLLEMSPFGYIRRTNLIGVGKCNNPFITFTSETMVTNRDSKRSKFATHAFVGVDDTGHRKIADATAGPHLATENLNQYLSASIDDNRKLYPGGKRCGNPSDVRAWPLKTVNLGLNSPAPRTANRNKQTKLTSREDGTVAISPNMINVNISRLKDIISTIQENSHENFHVFDYDHTISTKHSQLEWLLSTTSSPIEISISIQRSSDDAIGAMQSHLSNYQRPIEEFFTPSPSDFPDFTKELSSNFSLDANSSYSSMLWVEGNIFTRIEGPFPLQDLNETFAQPIKEHYAARQANSSDGNALQQPQIKRVVCNSEIEKGESFVLKVEVEDGGVSAISSGRNDIVILKKAEPMQKNFTFKAVGEGEETLEFAFAHVTSGVVVSASVQVRSIVESDEYAPSEDVKMWDSGNPRRLCYSLENDHMYGRRWHEYCEFGTILWRVFSSVWRYHFLVRSESKAVYETRVKPGKVFQTEFFSDCKPAGILKQLDRNIPEGKVKICSDTYKHYDKKDILNPGPSKIEFIYDIWISPAAQAIVCEPISATNIHWLGSTQYNRIQKQYWRPEIRLETNLWSSSVWKTWDELWKIESVAPTNLNYIVRMRLTHQAIVKIIRDIYNNDVTRGGGSFPGGYYREYTPESPHFYALLGSIEGQEAMGLLALLERFTTSANTVKTIAKISVSFRDRENSADIAFQLEDKPRLPQRTLSAS